MIQADPKNVVDRQRLAGTLSYIASAELFTGKPVDARRDARRSLEIAKEVADLPNANHDRIYTYAWLAVATYVAVKPGSPVPVRQKMMEDFLKQIRAGLKKGAAGK